MFLSINSHFAMLKIEPNSKIMSRKPYPIDKKGGVSKNSHTPPNKYKNCYYFFTIIFTIPFAFKTYIPAERSSISIVALVS